jgi:hypothetical protein
MAGGKVYDDGESWTRAKQHSLGRTADRALEAMGEEFDDDHQLCFAANRVLGGHRI